MYYGDIKAEIDCTRLLCLFCIIVHRSILSFYSPVIQIDDWITSLTRLQSKKIV